jgi:hypothetical protein
MSEGSNTMMETNPDIFDWIREIQGSEQPEVDKVRAFFDEITTRIIEYADKEIELAKAIQDRESLVKHQIKMETIKTARGIFARGYQIATGKKAWDEPDRC